MKKDYRYRALSEAVDSEMSKAFVEAIKLLDKEVVIKRLTVLMNYNSTEVTFRSIVGQFLSIINCETSADE